MANSKTVGDITEIAAAYHLVRERLSVSLPFGDNDKYDLIVDCRGTLLRVQCKTAWELNPNVIRFNTHSQTTKNGRYHETTYDGEIDAFLVRDPRREDLFWIPIEDATSLKMDLRFEADIDHPAINWADDYRLDTQIDHLISRSLQP